MSEKNEEVVEKTRPLCFRCEWRARYLETGHGPRCECQAEKSAVWSCYMFRPCEPYVLGRTGAERKIWGAKRPLTGPGMISARMSARTAIGDEAAVLTSVPIKQAGARGDGEEVMLAWLPVSAMSGVYKRALARKKREAAAWEKKLARMLARNEDK